MTPESMSPEHLRKVEELYHLVREAPSEARAALLARADPALRSEVESLLAQHGGDGVLDRPAMEVAAKLLEDSSMELAVGASLGPYKIESSIGAGGMGQVYKARDTRLGRAVAIKVSSREFIARFDREARAISALNHPHICTLHDIDALDPTARRITAAPLGRRATLTAPSSPFAQSARRWCSCDEYLRLSIELEPLLSLSSRACFSTR
jgi:serine/threonine protein kinase